VGRALIPSFPVGPARRSLRNRQRAGSGFPTVLPPTARQLGSLQIPLGTPANSPGQPPVRNSICLSGPVTRSIISSKQVILRQLGKVGFGPAPFPAYLKQPVGHVSQQSHRPCACALAQPALVLPTDIR